MKHLYTPLYFQRLSRGLSSLVSTKSKDLHAGSTTLQFSLGGSVSPTDAASFEPATRGRSSFAEPPTRGRSSTAIAQPPLDKSLQKTSKQRKKKKKEFKTLPKGFSLETAISPPLAVPPQPQPPSTEKGKKGEFATVGFHATKNVSSGVASFAAAPKIELSTAVLGGSKKQPQTATFVSGKGKQAMTTFVVAAPSFMPLLVFTLYSFFRFFANCLKLAFTLCRLKQ